MFFLKEDTVSQLVEVKFVDAVDGYSEETGITSPTVTIRKAGGAFAAINDGTWAELANGLYTVRFDATDSETKGSICLHIEKNGCRDYDERGYILRADVYDTLFDSDYLHVDVREMQADVLTAAAVKAEAVTKLQADLATALQITNLESSTTLAGVIKTAVEANGSKIDHVWEMTEDDAGVRRLTTNALEQSPTDKMSSAELATALDAYTNKADFKADVSGLITSVGELNDISVSDILSAVDVTEGGTWTLQKAFKLMFGIIAGKWQLKTGTTDTFELLDAEDEETVLLEMTASATTPYRIMTVKI